MMWPFLQIPPLQFSRRLPCLTSEGEMQRFAQDHVAIDQDLGYLMAILWDLYMYSILYVY